MQIENPQPPPKPQNRSADVSGTCVITATMGGEEGAVKARAHRGTNTEARPVSVFLVGPRCVKDFPEGFVWRFVRTFTRICQRQRELKP